MARPCCCRRIECKPISSVFKPKGTPRPGLGEITITLDEFEAVRLADLEGLYQEQAAARMEVSRPTFSRIVESARRKIAAALIQGQILKIEGGTVYAVRPEVSRCRRWQSVNADNNVDNVINKDGKPCCGRRQPSDCGVPRLKAVALPQTLRRAEPAEANPSSLKLRRVTRQRAFIHR